VGIFDNIPSGAAPTAREIQAIGAHGSLAGVGHRTALMNHAGQLLGIPPGGWHHGQSRLFEHRDLRLVWLLRRFAVRSVSERVAANLARTIQVAGPDIMLTVVTAARENGAALADVSMRMIDTWNDGGLDFLWAEKDRLGLPKSITGAWRRRETMISPETHNRVAPAFIPARDQTIAYAAQLRSSYEHQFRRHLSTLLGIQADTAIGRASRAALLTWKAYSFLAPGGASYDPGKTVAAQSGQPFGCRSALMFLAHRATSRGAQLDLNEILTVPDLNHVEWVRSSKVRAAEALFLERLLTVTRELLPPAGLYE
jgi:hypothetical protein